MFLSGGDWIEQEGSSFSLSHANYICTSWNSLQVARETELVFYVLYRLPLELVMITPRICRAFCLFKAVAHFIFTAFLQNV